MDTPLEQRLQGSWNQMRGRIREAWGGLTDDDVSRSDGKLDQLIGTIQTKTGETREAIRQKLDELARKV